jgi:hypothetical protein
LLKVGEGNPVHVPFAAVKSLVPVAVAIGVPEILGFTVDCGFKRT